MAGTQRDSWPGRNETGKVNQDLDHRTWETILSLTVFIFTSSENFEDFLPWDQVKGFLFCEITLAGMWRTVCRWKSEWTWTMQEVTGVSPQKRATASACCCCSRFKGIDERYFTSEIGSPLWLSLRVQFIQNNEEDGTGCYVNQYLLIINIPSDCLIHIFFFSQFRFFKLAFMTKYLSSLI